MIRREGYKLCFNDFTDQAIQESSMLDEFKIYKNNQSIELAWSIISTLSILCCAAAYGLDGIFNQE
jgi:type IV secretory pathway component VirB8